MIRYTLNCNNGHQFDSWFSDSASFEKLREKGHLECAICSSKKVEKSLKKDEWVNSVQYESKDVFLIKFLIYILSSEFVCVLWLESQTWKNIYWFLTLTTRLQYTNSSYHLNVILSLFQWTFF